MIGKASEFDKVVDGENISEYIVYELTLPGFAAKLRKYARKWYLLWVGLDPLLWILDLTADACHSAGAFFYCPSHKSKHCRPSICWTRFQAFHEEAIMRIPNLPWPSASDDNFDVDKILEEFDAFIVALARKNLPQIVTSPELRELDIDELAQNSRIKLWIAYQKKQIINLKAYIRRIVSTQAVDMVREHRPVLPLPTDEEGELYQGNLLVTQSEGMRDPLEDIEQEEMIADYIARAVDEVLKLPPRQQQSMIFSLREDIDDLLLLVDAFKEREVDIEMMNSPEEKEEIQRYRASRSAARKKMRSLKKNKNVHE